MWLCVSKYYLDNCIIMYTPRFLCFISILAPLNGLWTLYYSTSHVISTSRCSVLWYSSFVWLKASAKWRNANVNVPLLRVNPQCTPMGTAVNGWVMKHYWLPPSTMKAHQREEGKRSSASETDKHLRPHDSNPCPSWKLSSKHHTLYHLYTSSSAQDTYPRP